MTKLERLDFLTYWWATAINTGMLAVQTAAVILAVAELVRGRPSGALAAVCVAWVARRVER